MVLTGFLDMFALPLIFRSFDKRLLTAMVDEEGPYNLNRLVRDNLVTLCGYDANGNRISHLEPLSESTLPRGFHFLQAVTIDTLIGVARSKYDLNRLAREELDQRADDYPHPIP